MSRFSRFTSGVSASYASLVSHVFYSLAIVPIGLNYLGTEQFGLWMLVMQAAGYFGLLEVGVFGSAARILIDCKDRRSSDEYAATVVTAWAILAAQGMLMALACWVLAPYVVTLLNIPNELRDTAIYLLVFLGISTGLSTCFKIYSAILYANQRIDLQWLFVALNPIVNLAIIWPALAAGYGLYAVPWSFFPPVITTTVLSWLACRQLNLLPSNMSFANVRLKKIKELFSLGVDFFLINIGTQLLEASQLMIVSRTMGLNAAATWSISTKLFTLLFQLISKVENTAVVFLSEMMVRGEDDKLRSTFEKMYQFTGGLAVCGMLGVVAVNPLFVAVWAGESVLWPSINNWLVAVLLILNLLLRCHTDFAMHTKKIGLLRFLFFIESVAFVSAALWAAPRFGFTGILASAIICMLLFRSGYAIDRTASYFCIPVSRVAVGWGVFLVVPAILMGCVALFTPTLVEHMTSPAARALAAGAIVAVAAITILCSVGLPVTLRHAFHGHLRGLCTKCISTAFGR